MGGTRSCCFNSGYHDPGPQNANLCWTFPIKNALKGDALLSLLFNLALEYSIRKSRANHELLKFNGTHQVIINAFDVNLWGQSIHTVSFISPL